MPERPWRGPHRRSASSVIMRESVAIPAVRQKRSKLAPTSCQASFTSAVTSGAGVVIFLFMALPFFVESAPRAYRLKAGNAAPPISTSSGTSPAYGGMLEVAHIVDSDSGNPMPIPTVDDTGNTGAILHENTQVAEEPLAFGTVALGAFTYTSNLVRVSQELIQDSAFDLSGHLANVFGT